MARIEWVELRLNNWALWSSRRQGHGLGFSATSALMRMSEGSTRYREAHVPVDEVDASITDQAVQSLAASHPQVHCTVVARYLGGLSVLETASQGGKASSTISGHLDQADRLLARWFADRAGARRALAARGRPPSGSFTP